jgi:hypothetical protein
MRLAGHPARAKIPVMKNEMQDIEIWNTRGDRSRGWCFSRKLRPGLAGLCVALAAAVSGCAGSHQKLVLDTVGPAPAAAPGTGSGTGLLVVLSAREAIPQFDPLHDCSAFDHWAADEGVGYTWDYTGYKILNADGRRLRSVHNNVGNGVPHPEQIELPPGRYHVLADSAGYGRIKVPVAIVGGQTTVLHLDSNDFRPQNDGLSATNSVRLPNGNIIGWRLAAVVARAP